MKNNNINSNNINNENESTIKESYPKNDSVKLGPSLYRSVQISIRK